MGRPASPIGHFLARDGRRFHASSKPRHARGRVALPLGLAGAVHAGAPRQPAGPGVPREPRLVSGPGRGGLLPHRLRAPLRPAGRAEQPRPSVRPCEAARYLVELDERTYEADQVVIATGPFQVPRLPPVAGHLSPDVLQLHSTEYRRPDDIPQGPVLVAGGGNTGFQIAEELARFHEVHLSIGSRQTPLPQRILGRDLFSYLEATGLMRKSVDTRIGRRMRIATR